MLNITVHRFHYERSLLLKLELLYSSVCDWNHLWIILSAQYIRSKFCTKECSQCLIDTKKLFKDSQHAQNICSLCSFFIKMSLLRATIMKVRHNLHLSRKITSYRSRPELEDEKSCKNLSNFWRKMQYWDSKFFFMRKSDIKWWIYYMKSMRSRSWLRKLSRHLIKQE